MKPPTTASRRWRKLSSVKFILCWGNVVCKNGGFLSEVHSHLAQRLYQYHWSLHWSTNLRFDFC
jgi:hypothetical protein